MNVSGFSFEGILYSLSSGCCDYFSRFGLVSLCLEGAIRVARAPALHGLLVLLVV
jgi:hypothetical protein